jgi:hypothetical protein
MQTEQGKKEVVIVTRLVCYSVERNAVSGMSI